MRLCLLIGEDLIESAIAILQANRLERPENLGTVKDLLSALCTIDVFARQGDGAIFVPIDKELRNRIKRFIFSDIGSQYGLKVLYILRSAV